MLTAHIAAVDVSNGDSTGWTYYTTVSAPQTNYISLLRSWSSYNPYLVDGVKSSQFSISPLWDSYGWVGVVTFAGIYQDGLQQALQPDYTYHLQYAFTNGNINTFAPILSSGSRVTVFVSSTTGGSLGSQLTYVIPSDQISCTVTNSLGTNRTYIDIVFSTAGVTMVGDNSLDTYRYVAVPVYCQTDGKCVLEFVEMTGTQDPDLNVFRQNLLDILSEYANQNHTDLTNIYDVLFNQFTDLMGGDDSVQGDPYDGAVYDDMTEAEKDVFDSIDDFTVDFDGNTIQIDKNTFNVLMQYTNAHAHGYNTNVGVLLNRVVTVFTDYLAVPMVFSLLLGLVVWFMGKPVGG